MPGNTFGTLFRLASFGESHGSCVGGVIEGFPSNFPLSEPDVQVFLDERKPGGRGVSPRSEDDVLVFLSGIFQGKTTGAPIAFKVENQNTRSQDYQNVQHAFRPGHADFTYAHKYNHRDPRGGGRASARETIARVVGGALAQIFLKTQGIEVAASLAQVGDLHFTPSMQGAKTHRRTALFCDETQKLASYLETIQAQKDAVGAQVRCFASGVPVGLGEPIFDRLDARLAYAWMSIPGAKGVFLGSGMHVPSMKSSEFRDPITPNGFEGNHSGGTLGGISTGQMLVGDVMFKPTSSIAKPTKSINNEGDAVTLFVQGRHDPCIGVRAVPVVEAMMAMTLMDFYLMHRALWAHHLS